MKKVFLLSPFKYIKSANKVLKAPILLSGNGLKEVVVLIMMMVMKLKPKLLTDQPQM